MNFEFCRQITFSLGFGKTKTILVQVLCVFVCVFIKLHITAQSGPVILVILCHSH